MPGASSQSKQEALERLMAELRRLVPDARRLEFKKWRASADATMSECFGPRHRLTLALREVSFTPDFGQGRARALALLKSAGIPGAAPPEPNGRRGQPARTPEPQSTPEPQAAPEVQVIPEPRVIAESQVKPEPTVTGEPATLEPAATAEPVTPVSRTTHKRPDRADSSAEVLAVDTPAESREIEAPSAASGVGRGDAGQPSSSTDSDLRAEPTPELAPEAIPGPIGSKRETLLRRIARRRSFYGTAQDIANELSDLAREETFVAWPGEEFGISLAESAATETAVVETGSIQPTDGEADTAQPKAGEPEPVADPGPAGLAELVPPIEPAAPPELELPPGPAPVPEPPKIPKASAIARPAADVSREVPEWPDWTDDVVAVPEPTVSGSDFVAPPSAAEVAEETPAVAKPRHGKIFRVVRKRDSFEEPRTLDEEAASMVGEDPSAAVEPVAVDGAGGSAEVARVREAEAVDETEAVGQTEVVAEGVLVDEAEVVGEGVESGHAYRFEENAESRNAEESLAQTETATPAETPGSRREKLLRRIARRRSFYGVDADPSDGLRNIGEEEPVEAPLVGALDAADYASATAPDAVTEPPGTTGAAEPATPARPVELVKAAMPVEPVEPVELVEAAGPAEPPQLFGIPRHDETHSRPRRPLHQESSAVPALDTAPSMFARPGPRLTIPLSGVPDPAATPDATLPKYETHVREFATTLSTPEVARTSERLWAPPVIPHAHTPAGEGRVRSPKRGLQRLTVAAMIVLFLGLAVILPACLVWYGVGPKIFGQDSTAVANTAMQLSSSRRASPSANAQVIDVDGDPRRTYIVSVVHAGIIRLEPNQAGEVSFLPDKPVGRGELLVWLDRVQRIPSGSRDVADTFFYDLDPPFRSLAIDAYQRRIVVEWPSNDVKIAFNPAEPILARDAEAWAARMIVGLLPAMALQDTLGITQAEALDLRARISSLSTEELTTIVEGFQLRPEGGWANEKSITRSEAAEFLMKLQNVFDKYLTVWAAPQRG